jgi:hypothetical protein
VKITDRLLHHDRQGGFRHRLARFFGSDAHERPPLPVKREEGVRDPYDRTERRRRNRVRSQSRAVTRSRGQVMRS